ncbi:MAG: peptidoglycan-associated lipoprotein Pal [Pseudomonadota bacterium]
MTNLKPMYGAGAVAIALFLGACASTTNDRFDSAGAGGAVGALGSPSDPTSPAYFQQTVGDRVLFVVDQSTLTPEARATLDGQAGWLNSNPEFSVVVEGHADERGTTEYNIGLGARRATAVQEYLFTQGVALNRIETVSYGKERPLEICSDESCYNQNRRAVTVLTAGAGF